MMRWELVLPLVCAGVVSIWFMVQVARSDRSRLDKFAAFVLLSVPMVGPLLHWFVYNEIQPQHPMLQNRGPRGNYTHN